MPSRDTEKESQQQHSHSEMIPGNKDKSRELRMDPFKMYIMTVARTYNVNKK